MWAFFSRSSLCLTAQNTFNNHQNGRKTHEVWKRFPSNESKEARPEAEDDLQ